MVIYTFTDLEQSYDVASIFLASGSMAAIAKFVEAKANKKKSNIANLNCDSMTDDTTNMMMADIARIARR